MLAGVPLDDAPATEDLLGLPLVGAPKPPPVPRLAGPRPAPPPLPARHHRPPSLRATARVPLASPAAPPPAVSAPPPVPPPAVKAAPEPPPKRTEFLPGREAKPLVFDVPPSEPPPARPARVPDLPDPRRAAQPVTPPPSPTRAPVTPRPPAAAAARRPSPLLIDVTPLSLGVETVGGFCDILIEANTPVPCDRARSFATASAGQTSVRVRVSQGASGRFAENTFLGELELSGLAPAPRGETQIAVTFEIDADGILNVRARDVKTGNQTAARIQLVGAQGDPREDAAMVARQAAHPLAGLLGLR